MSDSNPLPALDEVNDGFQTLVDGVQPEQLDDPTPCTEWNVRRLIDHVVFGNVLFSRMATAEGDYAPPTPEERAQDHLGDDPAGAYRASAQRLRAAMGQPGFLETMRPSPFGQQPGAGLVQMRITEQLVHGWDLARATGQSPGFPDHIVEPTLAELRQRLGGRPRDNVPFGSEQPVPPDAPAIDQLAAFLGRRV